MLEHISLKKSAIKNENKQEINILKEKLCVLQQTIKEKKIPVIVLFEGWGASGKGSMISELISDLDPRSFKVFTIRDADSDELRKPLLWRFWNKIPECGRVSIFDTSWYKEISIHKIEEKLSEKEISKRVDNINIFERQLTDDGYVVIKFFLHISQKEQKDRLDKLSSSKNTAWRVTEADYKRNKHYETYYKAFDEMIEKTNTNYAPWHPIASHEKCNAVFEMLNVVVSTINSTVNQKALILNGSEISVPFRKYKLMTVPRLQDVCLDKTITDDEYDKELKEQQKIL